MALSSSQRQYLRKLAHDLKPVVQIGKLGLTDEVVAAVDQALQARELIKLKFLEYRDERREISDYIAELTRSEVIMLIGNVAVLYREQPDRGRRQIMLPAP